MFICKSSIATCLLSGVVLANLAGGTIPQVEAAQWTLAVQAGEYDRIDTPVQVELDGANAQEVRNHSLTGSPPTSQLVLEEVEPEGKVDAEPFVAQVEAQPGSSTSAPRVRLIWILKGSTKAGRTRRFRVKAEGQGEEIKPWSITSPDDGPLQLRNRDRLVFQYNTKPVANPSYREVYTRDAYLHPVQTPTEKLITGDFSTHHPHHRGIFLAYAKTRVGSLEPDFWNIQSGTGKIRFERLDQIDAGPVVARVQSRHRWEARGGQAVLEEKWSIAAYDLPGSPYWLFDLTATQQAKDDPVELLPYRYGGMAYRGAEPFVKGPLQVLTSEGLNRFGGDQKPARWVDLTGPVEPGSKEYGGAMILDHPSNVNHPSIARIHPILLPFFCYVPGHDKAVMIHKDHPTVFRYRIAVHDGPPNPERNQRLWNDFAYPPQVIVEPAPEK